MDKSPNPQGGLMKPISASRRSYQQSLLRSLLCLLSTVAVMLGSTWWVALVQTRIASAAGADQTTWNLVWSDEFNSNSLNTSNWTSETGGGGFGNNEREYYTNG